MGKVTGISTHLEMMLCVDPSNRRKTKGGIDIYLRPWRSTNAESIKQSVEPQSRSVRIMSGMCGEERGIVRESGSERAAALSRISLGARLGSSQLPVRAEFWELLPSFLAQPARAERKRCWQGETQPSQIEPSISQTSYSLSLCGQQGRSTDTSFLSYVVLAPRS